MSDLQYGQQKMCHRPAGEKMEIPEDSDRGRQECWVNKMTALPPSVETFNASSW